MDEDRIKAQFLKLWEYALDFDAPDFSLTLQLNRVEMKRTSTRRACGSDLTSTQLLVLLRRDKLKCDIKITYI